MNGSTMRFLFIDEAKLMTAGLFGQVYSSLEMHMHDANKFKYDLRNKVKPFGGLNLVLIGDMTQLSQYPELRP